MFYALRRHPPAVRELPGAKWRQQVGYFINPQHLSRRLLRQSATQGRKIWLFDIFAVG